MLLICGQDGRGVMLLICGQGRWGMMLLMRVLLICGRGCGAAGAWFPCGAAGAWFPRGAAGAWFPCELRVRGFRVRQAEALLPWTGLAGAEGGGRGWVNGPGSSGLAGWLALCNSCTADMGPRHDARVEAKHGSACSPDYTPGGMMHIMCST